MSEFSYVVVGAGIVGSWAARELAKYGSVLLLEQFSLPHTRGSSHGPTRLIRTAYAEPFYSGMMPTAFRMWQEAEEESGERLIQNTGTLCVADSEDNEVFQDFVENTKKNCPEYAKEVSAEDVAKKYPRTLKYSGNSRFLWDSSGGIIFAQKCVNTMQLLFKKAGGTLWESCRVFQIEPISAEEVKISCSRGEVRAKAVVVCAGTWTRELLKDLVPTLPLQPQVVKVHYWKEKETGAYSSSSGFPSFLAFTNPYIYGLPSHEYPGMMKICMHAGVPSVPEERDKTPPNPEFEKTLKSYVKDHFPLLEPEPAIVETCMYTCTPDEVYVIDTVPGHSNIVIGAGFSGMGFKTSPTVGRLLSLLARGEEPILSLEPFRLARFAAS